MSLPVDPYTFTNGTTADGGQVNARFAQLYAALAAGGLDPTVFAASALGSREVGLDVVGVEIAATSQVLTGTLTDITGATFSVTPTTASKLLVAFRCGLTATVSSGTDVTAGTSLLLDGTATIGGSTVVAGGANGNIVGGASVGFGSLSLSAAAHTIKLQSQMTAGAAGAAVVTGRTQIVGILVAA